MRIAQDQHYEGQDWWTWSVWIEAPELDLDDIAKVEWHVHPTFPQPLRVHTNRSEKFRLQTAGWGTFSVRATVVMKDGRTVPLRHDLELHYPDDEPS